MEYKNKEKLKSMNKFNGMKYTEYYIQSLVRMVQSYYTVSFSFNQK